MTRGMSKVEMDRAATLAFLDGHTTVYGQLVRVTDGYDWYTCKECSLHGPCFMAVPKGEPLAAGCIHQTHVSRWTRYRQAGEGKE